MKNAIKWFFEIVFLSWQAIVWIALIMIFYLILSNKFNLSSIKAGSFEFVLEKKAIDQGVFNTPEFRSMKNLNEDQLKLFLIMGGEEAKYYRFTNTALLGQASRDQYIRLQEDSLLRIEIRNDSTTMIYPTRIGQKLHHALVQSIYSELTHE